MGQPEPLSLELPEGTPRSFGELVLELRKICVDDEAQLLRNASFRLFALRWHLPLVQPKDLLHEAIIQTMTAHRNLERSEVTGEQGKVYLKNRLWMQHVELVPHLMNCMGIVAKSWYQKLRRMVPIDRDIGDRQRSATQQEMELVIAKALEAFPVDSLETQIIALVREGHKPQAIRNRLSLSEKAYNAVWRRIKNTLRGLGGVR